jgi:hypothetical protein
LDQIEFLAQHHDIRILLIDRRGNGLLFGNGPIASS